jgi:hypothetical protein
MVERSDMAALLERLRVRGSARQFCTCRTDWENCPACDCGHALDEIERLRGLLIHYGDMAGISVAEMREKCKL